MHDGSFRLCGSKRRCGAASLRFFDLRAESFEVRHGGEISRGEPREFRPSRAFGVVELLRVARGVQQQQSEFIRLAHVRVARLERVEQRDDVLTRRLAEDHALLHVTDLAQPAVAKDGVDLRGDGRVHAEFRLRLHEPREILHRALDGTRRGLAREPSPAPFAERSRLLRQRVERGRDVRVSKLHPERIALPQHSLLALSPGVGLDIVPVHAEGRDGQEVVHHRLVRPLSREGRDDVGGSIQHEEIARRGGGHRRLAGHGAHGEHATVHALRDGGGGG